MSTTKSDKNKSPHLLNRKHPKWINNKVSLPIILKTIIWCRL